jgi:YesN/AraC family two-component response regulator
MGHKASLLKTNSVLFKWMRSFLVVLLIPSVMMMVAYYQTNREMEKEINRANAALIGQLQQELDNQIEHIQRLSQVIALNPRIRDLLNIGIVPDIEQRLTIVKAMEDFRVYHSTNYSTSNFYVYFQQAGTVLNKEAYYDKSVYYQLYLSKAGISLEQWSQIVGGSYKGQYIGVKGSGDGEDSNGKIFFAQSLPMEDPGHALATLIVELDENRLQQAMSTIKAYNVGSVYMLNESNQILASTESTRPLQSGMFEIPVNQDFGVFDTVLDGIPVKVSYIKSKLLDWKYAYVLPAKLYREKADYIRNLTIASLVISLGIGAVISLHLSRRNYLPIKLLIQLLSVRTKLSYRDTGNEYDYIENAIENTLEEKNQIQLTLDRQNHMLRDNFLLRLLKGRIEDKFPLVDALNSYQLEFDSDRFVVMLFYIEDYQELFRKHEQDFEMNLQFVHLIITNIMEEMIAVKHHAIVLEADDLLACLVNVRTKEEQRFVKEELLRISAEAQQFISRKFHIQFTISLSDVHQTYKGIALAYQEALEAMEYRMLLGTQSLIAYDQIRNNQPSSYMYSIEQEQQLINFIKSGNLQKAGLILDEVIQKNLLDGNISIDMARCLMFDMISTVMKASVETLPLQSDLYLDNQRAVQTLLQCSTVAEMREQMNAFLEQVNVHVDNKKKRHHDQLLHDLIAFTTEQYADSNLSIQMIADHFDISPSYLSRYFKEHSGETITDYINKYRIANAKQLLTDTNAAIKEIAVQTGFYSINTFIRLFKKYEGITPGSYRDIQKKD